VWWIYRFRYLYPCMSKGKARESKRTSLTNESIFFVLFLSICCHLVEQLIDRQLWTSWRNSLQVLCQKDLFFCTVKDIVTETKEKEYDILLVGENFHRIHIFEPWYKFSNNRNLRDCFIYIVLIFYDRITYLLFD
jgi:hypothetical protein